MHASLSQAIRQRLVAFQRSLPDIGPSAHAGQGRAGAPHGMPADDRPDRVSPDRSWLDRAEVVVNEAGEHLRILVPVEALWPECHGLLARRPITDPNQEVAQNISTQLRFSRNPCADPGFGTASKKGSTVMHPELVALAAGLPHATLLLDLETCGFAGSAIFLIGLVRQVRHRLHVELLLARNYAEEPAILVTLRAAMATCRCLVTFNGKSFDWPMVWDRSIRHRLDPDRWPSRTHCDLLHHARRRWKSVLPNCRLQTLETHVCGRHRTDDVPGSAIPEVYHDYVRSGRTDRLAGILHHNGLDLVTLLDLALRMTCDG